MIAQWRWVTNRLGKRLWFRASLFSILGGATALLAIIANDFIPAALSSLIGADAVDRILGIIASSMLAVTTFSLSIMVTAFTAASNSVTPRATCLIMEDTTTQNALATFIGSFLFSLVGIIALSMGAYGSNGRVVLFAVTIVVVALIVCTLLQWIDHLSKLGQMGETIDRVEAAAMQAIKQYAQRPYLGGSVYPSDLVLPPYAVTIKSENTGYVQYIDVYALGAISQQHQIRIYLDVLPGAFVCLGDPLLKIVTEDYQSFDTDKNTIDKILATLTIGIRRKFEQDPRFGLCVLSEIASRALSAAINDPGTTIDVIGRGVRTLICLAKSNKSTSQIEQGFNLVFIRALTVEDLFDDFFAPISRDGAGLIEIDLRMIKALNSLSEIHPALFKSASRKHARILIKRAEMKLTLQDEKDQLKSLAALLKI